MPARVNPFARFYQADIELNRAREEAGKEQHSKTWWAEYLGVERSSISHWTKGDRRIGPKYEKQVFDRLNRYWAENKERDWASFVFTADEYRRHVPTAAQSKELRRRSRERKRARASAAAATAAATA